MSLTLSDILTTLTFRERNYILSLLNYIELEWEFVFWCFRTDPNTISIPARRSDVVNNVDWYNTYRRRIATENNWRHGYSNTTEMDLKWSLMFSWVIIMQLELKKRSNKAEPHELSLYCPMLTRYGANITVLDMESATKHSGFIDDIWDATCFYETNDESAIVYTVIFKKDDKGRIEWALHQFSGTSQVNRIRSGWFYVAAIFFTGPKKVYAIDQSQVVLEFSNDKGRVFQIIVHSVASSGQSDEPHNTPWLKYGGLPIPLLKAGLKCDYSKPMIFYSKPFSDDQSMQFSDFSHYRHVIGSLYCIVEGGYKQEKVYLVDIDKKEIVRKIESTKSYGAYGAYSFIGVRIRCIVVII
ncbi:hypothetical protein BDF22DRAFT_730749 [Syncephalis plumigaleata]|nr:hypothetical protein BDF22DRAFT_730749 [Syncephalis plumigaleata]